MKAIIGLGNPGREYVHTKHNVGFDVLDILAKRHKARILTKRCHALVGSFDYYGEEILLIKPQTYMNESGLSVGEITRKHNIPPESILVVYDDMDLPPGKIRLKPSGSSGGHKGMKSIIQRIGTQDFPRLRVGIGHTGDAINHVLSRFNRKDKQIMEQAYAEAADAVDTILKEGLDAAMNIFNRGEK